MGLCSWIAQSSRHTLERRRRRIVDSPLNTYARWAALVISSEEDLIKDEERRLDTVLDWP